MTGGWWGCDRGHSVPIADDAPALFWQPCPQCPAGGPVYRIERDVPEDDPARVVDRPSEVPA